MADADFQARLNRIGAKPDPSPDMAQMATPKPRKPAGQTSFIVLFLVSLIFFPLGVAGGMFTTLALDPDITPDAPGYLMAISLGGGAIVLQLALIGFALFKRFRSKLANAMMIAFLAGIALTNLALG